MLLECGCGKMYRVRDDAANPPTKCPACGGALRVSGGAPAPAPAGQDPRVKELETKVAGLEKALSATRAALELKDRELEEARGKAAAAQGDLDEAHRDLSRLEEELQEARAGGDTVDRASFEAKERELADALSRLGNLEQDAEGSRSKAQSGAVGLLREKDREIEEAQASIARLGEDLAKAQAAYHEALKVKDAELEEARRRAAEASQPAPDPEAGEKARSLDRALARIASLEKMVQDAERHAAEARAQAESAPPSGEVERALARVATLEKVVQDAEQRASVLKEELEASHSRENNPQALAEKDKVIAALEAEVAARRSDAEGHRKRADNLDQLRKADQGSFDTKMTAQGAVGARVGEARYLAGDLQRNLESIEAALSGLVLRVKRLHDALHVAEEEHVPAEKSGVMKPPTSIAVPGRPSTVITEVPKAAPLKDSPASEGEESFPEPDLPGDLPADETMLDMGKIGKSVREYREQHEAASPDVVPLAPANEEPAADDAPLSAETSPGPIPEDADAAKKKGFFGKLFGKK